MQTWASLQRELLLRGFHSADFVSFTCPEHGRFRGAVQDLTCRCPTCNCSCRPQFLGPGLTKSAIPLFEQSPSFRAAPAMHECRPKVKLAIKFKLSKFERMARKLKLDTEESLVNSARLRGWARNHRCHDYVPEWLLCAWQMPVFEKDAISSPVRD